MIEVCKPPEVLQGKFEELVDQVPLADLTLSVQVPETLSHRSFELLSEPSFPGWSALVSIATGQLPFSQLA